MDSSFFLSLIETTGHLSSSPCHRRSFYTTHPVLSSSRLLSGPLSSVVRDRVRDVRLHPRLQRVLYRVGCQ